MRKTQIIIGILLIAVLLALGACVPTPVSPKPQLPSPVVENPPGNVIRDLAYIKGFGMGYTDDADPESEGVDIGFSWYDSRSRLIDFTGIPISVTVELFTRKINTKTGNWETAKCVYRGETQIGSSLSEIRIPFDDMQDGAKLDSTIGIGKATFHTPQQGDLFVEFDVWY